MSQVQPGKRTAIHKDLSWGDGLTQCGNWLNSLGRLLSLGVILGTDGGCQAEDIKNKLDPISPSWNPTRMN